MLLFSNRFFLGGVVWFLGFRVIVWGFVCFLRRNFKLGGGDLERGGKEYDKNVFKLKIVLDNKI